VFDACSGRLVGLVSSPLHYAKGASADINLVVPLAEFVSELSTVLDLKLDHLSVAAVEGRPSARRENADAEQPSLQDDLIGDLTAGVLLIHVSGRYASGVCVDSSGVVMTSAHLFSPLLAHELEQQQKQKQKQKQKQEQKQEHQKNTIDGFAAARLLHLSKHRIRVRVDSPSKPSVWCAATPLFVSTNSIDMALLRLEDNFPRDSVRVVRPCERVVRSGMRAYAVGYGPFGNSSSGALPALVSSGVVSKVLRRAADQLPLFVQSCTTVHRGTSGGPLLDEDGTMIGLVTINARGSDHKPILTMNFSLSSALLRPAFEFAHSGDASVLTPLLRNEPELTQMQSWQFEGDTSKQSTQLKVHRFLAKL